MQFTQRKTSRLQPYFNSSIDEDQNNIFLIRTARKNPQSNKKIQTQPHQSRKTIQNNSQKRIHQTYVNNFSSHPTLFGHQFTLDMWNNFKKQMHRKKFFSQSIQNQKIGYINNKKINSETINGVQTAYILSKRSLKTQKKKLQKQNTSNKVIYRAKKNLDGTLKKIGFQRQDYIRIAHSIALHRNNERNQQRKSNSITIKMNRNRNYKTSHSHVRQNSLNLTNNNIVKYGLIKQNSQNFYDSANIRPWSGLKNTYLQQQTIL